MGLTHNTATEVFRHFKDVKAQGDCNDKQTSPCLVVLMKGRRRCTVPLRLAGISIQFKSHEDNPLLIRTTTITNSPQTSHHHRRRQCWRSLNVIYPLVILKLAESVIQSSRGEGPHCSSILNVQLESCAGFDGTVVPQAVGFRT